MEKDIQPEALAGQQSQPLKLSRVMAELSACLALVRPVSMGDDMAKEFLTVAAKTVLGFAERRPIAFLAACDRARRDCTHHGQIVPTILKTARPAWEPQGVPHETLADERKRKDRAAQLEASPAAKLIESAAKALKS